MGQLARAIRIGEKLFDLGRNARQLRLMSVNVEQHKFAREQVADFFPGTQTPKENPIHLVCNDQLLFVVEPEHSREQTVVLGHTVDGLGDQRHGTRGVGRPIDGRVLADFGQQMVVSLGFFKSDTNLGKISTGD